MERLVSSEFYNILCRISDQDMNSDLIFDVFKNAMDDLAPKFGIVQMKAKVYSPISGSREFSETEIVLYDISDGKEINAIELEFLVGNGGRVVVTSAVNAGDVWTNELKEDNYVISRLIYLLVGRANTMTTLTNLTLNDQMTGISNKTGLTKFMGKTMSKGIIADYSSNFINIKNMKLTNSRYGDAAGDSVIIGYAKAIESFAKDKGNGIAARLGGDNFFVFIEKEHEEEFIEFVKGIKIPYTDANGDKTDITVESRLGYYLIKPGDGINELMRNADVASQVARKDANPDYIQYEEYMINHILKTRQLEQSIPGAIRNREFVVYYQPKADISENGVYKLNGAEALVRWMKDGEMVSPGEFIPILEKNGLISLVDYYVLEQVCVDIKDWISRGLKPVKVSSNFSRRHLQDAEFADKVEAIIKKHNIDPKYIEIEITESYDDKDIQALKKFEQRMHSLGIDLSVDDFGSGFSSIKMIKHIVADTIKLDKSIIDGIGENNADDIIISHIIMMIDALDKNVIAEGVETEKQVEFLRDNGCKNIQGFIFARPCPKKDYETYMI